MNIEPQAGDKMITMFAVFEGDKQLTRWNRNKQKSLSAFKRSGHYPIFKTTPKEHSNFSIRSQVFIHRKRDSDDLLVVPETAQVEKAV